MQSIKRPANTADAKQVQYSAAVEYTPTEITQTGLHITLNAKAYTAYVAGHVASPVKVTVVSNKKSEERVRTLNANKRMASWVNR